MGNYSVVLRNFERMPRLNLLCTIFFTGLAVGGFSQRFSTVATAVKAHSLGIAVDQGSTLWIWTEHDLFLSRDAGENWVRRSQLSTLDSLKAAATVLNTAGGERLSVNFADSSVRLLRKTRQSSDQREIAHHYPGATASVRCAQDGQPQLVRTPGGRLYVAWSDAKAGPSNKDVYLTWSDDNGQHWPEPVVVTYRPNHKHQFMPALALDPDSVVYLLYLDQQNSAWDNFTDVYLARSKNGGLLFDKFRLNETPIACAAALCAPALCVSGKWLFALWLVPDTEGGSLMLCRIGVQELEHLLRGPLLKLPEKTISWNGERAVVPFELPEAGRITAVLTNPVNARATPVVLVNNKKYRAGHHVLRIKSNTRKLKKGNYTITFYDGQNNDYVWLMEE